VDNKFNMQTAYKPESVMSRPITIQIVDDRVKEDERGLGIGNMRNGTNFIMKKVYHFWRPRFKREDNNKADAIVKGELITVDARRQGANVAAPAT
jgi:hypothetical protein